MCSKPKAPKAPPPPPPPPPPQEAKLPETVDKRRPNMQKLAAFTGVQGSTLLTSATGAGPANVGSTLLGGQ